MPDNPDTSEPLEFEDLPPWLSRDDLWNRPDADDAGHEPEAVRAFDELRASVEVDQQLYTVEENTYEGFDVVAPDGEIPATYPWTLGGKEHAEMLANADRDARNGTSESEDPRLTQAEEVLVEATLDPSQVIQIKDSALRADEAVRDPEAVRAYQTKLKEELGPDVHWTQLENTHERAHEAWHQAIREKCSELGVGAGAYFHSDPDEVDNCDATCTTTWPEVTTVAIEDHPYDMHLTLHTYLEGADLTVDEPEASLQEMPTNRYANDDEWLQSVLDDAQPVSELDTGMGSGY